MNNDTASHTPKHWSAEDENILIEAQNQAASLKAEVERLRAALEIALDGLKHAVPLGGMYSPNQSRYNRAVISTERALSLVSESTT